MRLPFFIANRYLLSRKSPNVVNIITLISIAGIALGAMALVVVLSVFNGFNSLIRELYEGFDPDIQIVSTRGRYLKDYTEAIRKLKEYRNLKGVSQVIEGKAILEYSGKQSVIRLKGVDKQFRHITDIDSFMSHGKFNLINEEGYQTIVLGRGVANGLSAGVNDVENPMELYTVSEKSELISGDPARALNKTSVVTTGFFFVQQKEYDQELVLCDLEIARNLFESGNQITALELKLHNTDNVAQSRNELKNLLGDDYEVKTWYEQHDTLNQVMRNEKAVGFLIISFMLVLASFNVVGSLTMIVMEKKKDIAMLRALGMQTATIRNIFLMEGFLIGGLGGSAGVFLGGILCTIQERYRVFKLGEADQFVIDYWPVAQLWTDYLAVFLTIFILSALSGLYPSWKAARTSIMLGIRQ